MKGGFFYQAANEAEVVEWKTLETKMAELESLCYSYEVLTSKPLPPDVDPLRIEDFLSDLEFQVPPCFFKHKPRLKFQSSSGSIEEEEDLIKLMPEGVQTTNLNKFDCHQL